MATLSEAIWAGTNGTLRPNLKPMRVDRQFSVDDYSIRVMGELRRALKGLVER